MIDNAVYGATLLLAAIAGVVLRFHPERVYAIYHRLLPGMYPGEGFRKSRMITIFRALGLAILLLMALVLVSLGLNVCRAAESNEASAELPSQSWIAPIAARFFEAFQDPNRSGEAALQLIREEFPLADAQRADLGQQVDQAKKQFGLPLHWELVGEQCAIPNRLCQVCYVSLHKATPLVWIWTLYRPSGTWMVSKLSFSSESVFENTLRFANAK